MTATSFGPKNEPRYADADAPDVAVNPTQVAAYAAKVGNRRVGTTAERDAAAGADVWEELRWADTTLKREYVYRSGAWVPAGPIGVTFVGSTNTNGILAVTHNFGVAPVWAQVTMQNGGNDALSKILSPIVWDTALGATSMQIRFRRTDTNDWAASQPVSGFLTLGL